MEGDLYDVRGAAKPKKLKNEKEIDKKYIDEARRILHRRKPHH